MPRRSTTLLAKLVLGTLVATATACAPGGVHLSFRPEEGMRYLYEIEVASATEVSIPGEPADRDEDRVVLRAEHEVLSRDREQTRVRVRLRARDADPRTFVVTLDRTARLTEVERVENLPASALGELGLSEIFPAAAGAPPDRALRPGERWEIDEHIALPSGRKGQLRGYGRVAELRVVDGTKAAVVTTDVTVTVGRRARGRLAGTQRTMSRSIHAIADGAVIEARARTVGDFTVAIAQPPGRRGPSRAALVVEVSSTTRLESAVSPR